MAQSSGRQKVRLRRLIGTLSSTSLPELARQTKEGFDSLVTGINDAVAGFALRIIDGTVSPKRELPDREKLEFGGDLDVSTTKDRHIISVTLPAPGVTDHGALTGLGDNDHTQYANAAVGYDGVTSTLAGQTVTTRRDQTTISISTSGAFNDWAPAAGWRTTRVLLFNPTGFTVINGFDAPSGANDTLERECWNTSTSTEFDISHDSGSNSSVTSRVLCPDNLDFRVRPRSGWWMRWDTVASRWRITATSQDHGRLRGLSDDDHTQYILVAGTRAFTGDQSMGTHNLTSIGQAVMNNSSSQLVMSGGSIVQVDDITSNGSSAVWNLVGGSLRHAEFLELYGVAPGVPTAGEVRVHGYTESSVSPAHINVKAAAGQLIDHPEMVAYETGTAAGGATGTISVNFGSINGRSLSDGVFKVIVKVVAKNITASRSYPQINLLQWIHYEMDVGGTNTYSQIMEQPLLSTTPGSEVAIAYWNGGNVDTTTIFIDHLRVGGSTLDILWAANPGGTDDWTWFVSVKIEGQ